MRQLILFLLFSFCGLAIHAKQGTSITNMKVEYQTYSQYLPVFRFGLSIQLDKKTKTKKAAFLLGGNDKQAYRMELNKVVMELPSGRYQIVVKQ